MPEHSSVINTGFVQPEEKNRLGRTRHRWDKILKDISGTGAVRRRRHLSGSKLDPISEFSNTLTNFMCSMLCIKECYRLTQGANKCSFINMFNYIIINVHQLVHHRRI